LLLFLLVSLSAPGLAQKAATSTHQAPTSQKKRAKARKSRTTVSPVHKKKLHRAFVQSADLRPMAKQLLEQPSATAYAAVGRYATKHRADQGGMLAHLVLGYAHLQDKDYPKADKDLKLAAVPGSELSDYADFFLAQSAATASSDQQRVAGLLKGFGEKHPDSLLIRSAELMRANALLASGQPEQAMSMLEAMRDNKPDVEL